ncbi:hypothetical protein EV1_011296 [Malus domestica]
MQDNTILYSSDRKVVFMKVVSYLVNYNISKFEIHRSSTTPEIQTCCELLNSIFSCSSQHTFFIEVVPHLVSYNISKFEIHRSSTNPEIQLVNYNISKFEIPRSCITQEIQLFICSKTIGCPKFSSIGEEQRLQKFDR